MDIAATEQNKPEFEKQSMTEQQHNSVSDQQGIDQIHSEVQNPANGVSVHIEPSYDGRTLQSSIVTASILIENNKESIPEVSFQQSDQPIQPIEENQIEKPTETLSATVQQTEKPTEALTSTVQQTETSKEAMSSTVQLIEASKDAVSYPIQSVEVSKEAVVSNPAQPIQESKEFVSNPVQLDVQTNEISKKAVVSNPAQPIEESKESVSNPVQPVLQVSKEAVVSNLAQPFEVSKVEVGNPIQSVEESKEAVNNSVQPFEISKETFQEKNNPVVQQEAVHNPAQPSEISKEIPRTQVQDAGNNEIITAVNISTAEDGLKLSEMERVSSTEGQSEVSSSLKHELNPLIENYLPTEERNTDSSSHNAEVANLEQQTIDEGTSNNKEQFIELLSQQCETVKNESARAGLETEHSTTDVKAQDESSETSGEIQPTRPESVGSSLHHVVAEDQLLKTVSTGESKPSSNVSNFKRAEIDTAAPFESVKAAVSMFGERMDWKSQPQTRQAVTSSVDRSVVPEHNVQKLQEEIEYHKAKLSSTQTSTVDILRQLENVKDIIYKTSGVSDQTVASVKDKTKNIELELVLKEMERVKDELCTVTVSKQAALEGLQGARVNLNMVSKRIDELTEEQKTLNEAMNDAQNALGEAEDQVAILKSGGADSQEALSNDLVEVKSAEIKLLESKLDETNAAILKLKGEIKEAKENEGAVKVFTTENGGDLQKVKLELEEAKSKEVNNVKKIEEVLTELDGIKDKVEKATQDRVALSSAVLVLKADIERGRMELDEMHEKEQAACASLAALQDELGQVKDSLTSVKASEARAIAAKDTLPTEIRQAALEADKVKAAAELSKEEARRARHEMEEAKAAASTAQSRLQAALKEAEAARASEAMALAEFKALSESENQGHDTNANSEGVTYINVSLEEYSSLKSAADEAEDRSGKRVAEVLAHLEQAKASQLNAQSKLEDAVKQSKVCHQELEEAQKKAEYAQEAKLASEAALRKWRGEHEQLRKAVNIHELQERKTNNDKQGIKLVLQEKAIPHEKKVPGPDSLSQVLSLRVPRAEVDKGLPPLPDQTKEKEKTKKKPFIKRIASAVVGKKGNGTVLT